MDNPGFLERTFQAEEVARGGDRYANGVEGSSPEGWCVAGMRGARSWAAQVESCPQNCQPGMSKMLDL